jgi:ankyrin repeat protein
VVSMLLKNGADISVLDQCGWTPLHDACSRGQAEVVTALIVEYGADITVRASVSVGMIDWIELSSGWWNSSPQCFCFNSRLCRSSIIPFKSGCKYQCERRGECRGCMCLIHPQDGFIPLHDACSTGWGDVITVLLEAGADIKARTNVSIGL